MLELYGWLGGVLAFIVGALALWFGGRSSGKDTEKAKRSEEVIQTDAARRKVQEVVLEAQRNANAETDDAMRDRFKRDSVRSAKKN